MLRAEVRLLYFKVSGFHYYFLSRLGFEKTLFDYILSATFVLLTPSRSLAFTQFQNNLVLLPCLYLQPKYSSDCSREYFDITITLYFHFCEIKIKSFVYSCKSPWISVLYIWSWSDK